MSQLIPFTDEHSTVIGRTRSGKTYAVKKTLSAQSGGVFFFNTQLEDMPKSFVRADKSNEIDTIKKALQRGRKVNYTPSTDREQRQRELAYIIGELYDGHKHDITFVADEVHLYTKKALDALVEIATTGLRFGIKGVFISQRMANIDNTLFTQSTKLVMFESNLEAQYFRAKGIPYEDIDARLQQGGKYTYCIFDGKNVTGAFKV